MTLSGILLWTHQVDFCWLFTCSTPSAKTGWGDVKGTESLQLSLQPPRPPLSSRSPAWRSFRGQLGLLHWWLWLGRQLYIIWHPRWLILSAVIIFDSIPKFWWQPNSEWQLLSKSPQRSSRWSLPRRHSPCPALLHTPIMIMTKVFFSRDIFKCPFNTLFPKKCPRL